ncbi:hypothetical protein SAPIO_CDS4614 [Scedosporium apiospermum]|uniref:chitinase n=1 Tax=Pseudallescheria apiosperma TaxID=563466 RepID=A0A084G7X1_PSEDA|nr:uncharacterized protein SAPIO_CDS4614 [Scedosporium apiospermum]KEZ43433.1 hypothetical protein SAPIO_CDS4614 [Scedosporium apiospermum]
MAFYDAFNTKDRPNCYDINVSAIPDYFSHIHFAFADLTADYQLDVSRTSDQFEALKKMPNKKIISIGIGEKFNSTMSKMLHAGVQSDKADLFSQSIGAFIDSHGLDGVSLAWSPYAGEVDQYISFLGTLRSQLPAGKTISVAIDRHFQDPKYKIKQIADAIDHFIFKAFDYHGYLDVLSQPQLFTNSGVPSTKIFIGMAHHGRSVKLADAECFNTTYPAFETYFPFDEDDKDKPPIVRDIYDSASKANIFIYNDDQYISWLDREARMDWFSALVDYDIGGIVDWMYDLTFGVDTLIRPMKANDTNIAPRCDFSRKFKDLNEVDRAMSEEGVNPECAGYYSLIALESMLDDAIQAYEDIDSDNFNENWDSYGSHINNTIQIQLDRCINWIDNGPCNKYFHCAMEEADQFLDEGTCPLGKYDPARFSDYVVTYTLEDEDGFYRTLSEEYGIERDWVKFGETLEQQKCHTQPQQSDSPQHDGPGRRLSRRQECHSYRREVKNKPMKADDIQVSNPKELIKQVSANLTSIQAAFTEQRMAIISSLWNGTYHEPAEAYSMPVFMFMQAVESMNQAAAIGEEYRKEKDEKKRKEMVLSIITGMLIFIPFAGEAAAAIGWASSTIAKIGILIGAAGDAGLMGVDLVQNPEAAPMAALGMLLMGGGARSAKRVAELAEAKKAMGGDDLAKLGAVFKANEDKLQAILNVCRKQ